MDCTLEQMLVDHWAWRHAEDPHLKDAVVADDYDTDLADMEAEALAREAEQAAKVAAVPESDWEDI